MKKYQVTFIKYEYYDVWAESDEDAYEKAYEEFCADAHLPIADTEYDEVEVEEIEDESIYTC